MAVFLALAALDCAPVPTVRLENESELAAAEAAAFYLAATYEGDDAYFSRSLTCSYSVQCTRGQWHGRSFKRLKAAFDSGMRSTLHDLTRARSDSIIRAHDPEYDPRRDSTISMVRAMIGRPEMKSSTYFVVAGSIVWRTIRPGAGAGCSSYGDNAFEVRRDLEGRFIVTGERGRSYADSMC